MLGRLPGSDRLGPAERDQSLRRMAEQELDVLVIGGGVVGAGSALDAVTRGLRVGLVEARDYASGTSSRSSKLVHGGVRYLEQLDFRLVREALMERGLLLQRLAPHLVRPVPFLYPLTHRVWERAYVGAGFLLYDSMAMSLGQGRGLPHHRHLSRRAALELFPALRRGAVVGGVLYYDAQVDDARYTLAVVRTAASYGASVANRVQVVNLLREAERVTGARVRDLESGRELEVRARQVVSATGVWSEDIQRLATSEGQIHVRMSKGVHLVVPRDRIQGSSGLILRTEKSVLFVVPWDRYWIIGTTDTDWVLDKAHPAASRADIDYLLGHLRTVLSVPIGHEDVEGVYAGLRPLLAGESEATSELSREHQVVRPMPGLVMVAGGKYTTYRVMAKDAVDAVVRGLHGTVPPSCTDEVPLVGADGYRAVYNARRSLVGCSGLALDRIEHLLTRYGSRIFEVLEMVDARPELGQPIDGADRYLQVEARYAASHEGARHLEDVLTRRTRISIETWDRGVAAAESVARLMAEVLGWSDDQVKAEIGHYCARVAAERSAQQQVDDRSAETVRLEASEIVPTCPLETPVSAVGV